MSLLTFSLSFTLFRRQWQRLFRHPQKFIRGTSGPFIHIMESNPAYYEKADSSFLYFTSTHWSLLHTKLCTKRTRNLRIILLRALPLSNLAPTTTSLLRSTHRLQPETAFFCVSCMHSIFIILSHMSSFISSSPTLLLNFS